MFKSFIFYKIRDNYGFGGSNNSSIIRPALEHIFNLYKLEVENLYNYNKENIDTGLGIDPERKNLYKWFENNIIINDEDIRKSFKYILPVYKYITTSPKVIKRNTNDNATKYWNILEIELPLCTIDHGEAMNIIKEHKNELFQYIFWYLSVTDKEIYEMRKFLKIDNIFLTKDFILSIQYVLKGDDKAGI